MSDPSPQDFPRGRVAYIAHYFPALTQTFVYREVQALEALGWKILPYSIRRPTKGISDEARELAARTAYLLPLRPLRFLGGNLAALARNPRGYLGALLSTAAARGERARARSLALAHSFGALCLVRELEAAGVRHIHAHFATTPATLAMAAAGFLGIPFSMTIHARDLFTGANLLRTKIERAKFVVTISAYNREILASIAPAAAAKIRVVHCGVDLERFAPAPRDASPARERPTFLAVGRLVEKKGFRYLVEAAAILARRRVLVEIRVVGGGPEADALARRAAELGVADSVRLEGPLSQERLLPELRAADAFVLPCVRAQDGDQDGIPVSLMEAMACEIPCVSTRISGIPELIEDGKEGLLVPEKDPEALAGAIERLAADPALRREYGRAARKKVEAAFSLAVQARELDRLLRS